MQNSITAKSVKLTDFQQSQKGICLPKVQCYLFFNCPYKFGYVLIAAGFFVRLCLEQECAIFFLLGYFLGKDKREKIHEDNDMCCARKSRKRFLDKYLILSKHLESEDDL